MNISLDLSKSQLSKLRNGHGIRIGPAMFGKGVDMIIDPMTYNNMIKKLERGKGAVISMSGGEIEENKMEGTGLFAGSGNKSGKISRRKKAEKWRDFSDKTLRKGIDTSRYGYEQFKEATNPVRSGIKKLFGGELDSDEEELEGEGIFDDIKKGYNRKVKNSDLGKALRGSAKSAISDGYDRGANELGKNKYGKPISQYMKNKRGSNTRKLSGYTGLGLKLEGDGRMKRTNWRNAVEEFPGIDRTIRPAVVRPAVVRPDPRDMMQYFKRMKGKGLRVSGDGLRVSGSGHCGMCGGTMNDNFFFSDSAL